MKILLAGIMAASAQSVLACDLCAIYAATEAHAEIGRGPFVGVAEQFTHFGTVQIDGREVSNPSGQYLNSSVSQVFAGYNITKDLGIQLNVPVIYRSYKRPDSQGGIERGTESGIGDISLLANYNIWHRLRQNSSLSLNVLAGVKFPTGSSSRIKEEFNEVQKPIGPPSGIHGHDLTLGSGSFDGFIGSSLFARWHHYFLTANLQYAIRSEGDFGYQFANDLTWAGGPGYYILLQDDYSLSLQAITSGENKDKDTFGGATAEDTGVTSVYLGPQIVFTWQSNLSVQLAADLPISIQNTALQTVPDYRIRASFTWHF